MLAGGGESSSRGTFLAPLRAGTSVAGSEQPRSKRQKTDTRTDAGDVEIVAAAPCSTGLVAPMTTLGFSTSAMAASAYTPMIGAINNEQVEEARREFERRVKAGELDVRVTMAEKVPVEDWEAADIYISGLRLDYAYSPDGALVDVEIFDAESLMHCAVVQLIAFHLRSYVNTLTYRQHFLGVGAGDTVWQHGGRTFKRTPDTGIHYEAGGIIEHRFIVEVVVHNPRTLGEAQRRCREYFIGQNGVRTVLLLMFLGFDRIDRSRAAAVAILYRRDDSRNGNVMVDNVVSFGTADHTSTRMDVSMLEEIDPSRRGGNQRIRDLHGSANNKPIEIHREDLFLGAAFRRAPQLILNLAELFDNYWRYFRHT